MYDKHPSDIPEEAHSLRNAPDWETRFSGSCVLPHPNVPDQNSLPRLQAMEAATSGTLWADTSR